ncbi:hypothetical protein [Burkholderia sp. Ac-20365]|uniref:hypothetical protein n=1 Tax=Burkholderia sp. Ac-20365 TaxID=2703897 RepID=UPI00197B0F4E|nr:hypothetical protein [Burkholderia sp. Ac-20365]
MIALPFGSTDFTASNVAGCAEMNCQVHGVSMVERHPRALSSNLTVRQSTLDFTRFSIDRGIQFHKTHPPTVCETAFF